MRRPTPPPEPEPSGISRRGLITGALIAGGLGVGWMLWPQSYSASPALAPGEIALNGYLKLGNDGHVTVITPQSEFGQGQMTLIAQILADELGADWRTIGVEAAPASRYYANAAFETLWEHGWLPALPAQGSDDRIDVAMLEASLRPMGAAARILLCQAAARQWGISPNSCTTENGFVIAGEQRARFGELAAAATRERLPNALPLRVGKRPLVGQRLARLDVPAKLDGSLTYAGDIRLPDMLHASIRIGPPGSKLEAHDAKAARAVPGFAGLVAGDGWLAAAANSWWMAERILQAAQPRFSAPLIATNDKTIEAALQSALAESSDSVAGAGDIGSALGGKPFTRDYAALFAPHALLEPLAAAAALDNGKLQIWIATNLPGAAQAAAALGAGVDPSAVVVHALQGGGSFGRRFETETAVQVAKMARTLNRPVMLQWPREEDIAQDRMRPPALAKASARTGAGGRIEALRIAITTPNAPAETRLRTLEGYAAQEAQSRAARRTSHAALGNYALPYAIPAWSLEHHGVDLGMPSGLMRGGAAGAICFAVESFIDELAQAGGVDPFSIRIGLLSGQPRLAQCLSRVAARGEWKGGAQGEGQGLACYTDGSSSIAVLAEARLDERQQVHVDRLVAVADIGRMIHPEIALQQIEGGLLHGLALATAKPVRINNGAPNVRRLGGLGLPRLADMPAISIEIVASGETPGPFGALALPPVAPAIANAIASASWQRFRTLPLGNP